MGLPAAAAAGPLHTTTYWYCRACRAVGAGAGGHLSGPFQEVAGDEQGRAIISLLHLRPDIGLPDLARPFPPWSTWPGGTRASICSTLKPSPSQGSCPEPSAFPSRRRRESFLRGSTPNESPGQPSRSVEPLLSPPGRAPTAVAPKTLGSFCVPHPRNGAITSTARYGRAFATPRLDASFCRSSIVRPFGRTKGQLFLHDQGVPASGAKAITSDGRHFRAEEGNG